MTSSSKNKPTVAVESYYVRSGDMDASLVAAMYRRCDVMRGRLFLPIPRLYMTADEVDSFMGETLTKPHRWMPNGRPDLRRAMLRSWLAGDHVELIVVGNAELLTGSGLRQIARHAAAIGAELWLICAHIIPDQKVRAGFASIGADERAPQDLLGRVDLLPPADEPSKHRRLNSVPSDDWPTFVAACRELLPPADVRLVEGAVSEGGRAISKALRGVEGDTSRARQALRDLLTEAAPTAVLVARTRGAQAAGVAYGVHIKLDYGRFVLGPATSLEPPTLSMARAVRATAGMKAPAICAVAYASNATPMEIAAMNVDDVDPCGDRIRCGGREFEVPDALRGPLRSLVLYLKELGATGSAPLFAHTYSSGERLKANRIRYELAEMSRQTGVRTEVEHSVENHRDDVSWLRRRGISVSALFPSSPARGKLPPRAKTGPKS